MHDVWNMYIWDYVSSLKLLGNFWTTIQVAWYLYKTLPKARLRNIWLRFISVSWLAIEYRSYHPYKDYFDVIISLKVEVSNHIIWFSEDVEALFSLGRIVNPYLFLNLAYRSTRGMVNPAATSLTSAREIPIRRSDETIHRVPYVPICISLLIQASFYREKKLASFSVDEVP